MRTTLVPTIASFLLLAGGAVAFAQDPPQQQPPAQQQPQARPQQQERDRSASPATPVTLKGCLTKGSQAQQYMVADEGSGEKVSFEGPAKLDTYLNQTVEIKGQLVEQGGAKTFQAESVKSVAATCAK